MPAFILALFAVALTAGALIVAPGAAAETALSSKLRVSTLSSGVEGSVAQRLTGG